MYYNNSYLDNIYNILNYSLQKQASEDFLEKYLEDILLEKQAEEILENYLQEQLLEKQAEESLENYLQEQLLEKQAEEILGNYFQEQLLEKQAESLVKKKYLDKVLRAVREEGVNAPESYASPPRKIKDIKNFKDLDPLLQKHLTIEDLWETNLNLRRTLQNVRKELAQQKRFKKALGVTFNDLIDSLKSGEFHANEGLWKTLGRWAKGSWRQGLGGKAKVLGAVGSTALSGLLPFLLAGRREEPQQIPTPQPSGIEGFLGGLNFSDPKTLLTALALAGGLGAGAYGLSRLFS